LLFSVVIPAHNAARTLADALNSVLIQSCQQFEIIVVDDGSTDATAEIAERTGGNRVRAVTQEQAGVSAARNRGIGLARAPWVSFLDADDLWLPSYLSKMESAIQMNPAISLLFTDAWYYDESARRILRHPMMARTRPTSDLSDNPSGFLTALLAGNFVFTSATASTEALLTLGGYDTELSHAEDYDLWLRLAATGRRSTFIGGPLVLYRIGSSGPSLSSDRSGMASGELHVLRRFRERHELAESQDAIARSRIERMTTRVATLEDGGRERRTLARRIHDRARRRGRGTVYRRPPTEVLEAFPSLVNARQPNSIRKRGRAEEGWAEPW
jgi:glycosyltransferase involved in cell wall biosynthesis